jgi:hypothetical protein
MGRLTSSPPTYVPISTSNGDDLQAAFEDFQRAQRETLALMQASELFEDPQMRAEAYRGLLYTIVGSIRAGALMEHDFPRFMRAVDWSSKSGLDNPDNNYYIALIRDDEDYLIRGNRGTTRNLVFQLIVGQPGVRGAGSSTNISVLNASEMHIEGDGSFEVLLSRNDPGPELNWLQGGEGAETVLVRMTHSDWATEHGSTLTIERLGGGGEVKPILSPQQMSESLRNAAVHMYDRTATWLNYADKAWLAMPRNDIAAARPSSGGLVGQWSAFGTWDLNNAEAIVLRSHPSNASYQGIELGNRWFVSLDYETRTSSLTLDQAERSSDGSYYFVISARDPGVTNWLDTESHESGLIMMRWQGLAGGLADELQPTAKRVPFTELHKHLPADTVRINAEQRREQISLRRSAVLQRDN